MKTRTIIGILIAALAILLAAFGYSQAVPDAPPLVPVVLPVSAPAVDPVATHSPEIATHTEPSGGPAGTEPAALP